MGHWIKCWISFSRSREINENVKEVECDIKGHDYGHAPKIYFLFTHLTTNIIIREIIMAITPKYKTS